MKIKLNFVIGKFLFLLSLLSFPVFSAGDEKLALKLVEKFQMGSNLESIGYQFASTMVTGQGILQKYGSVKGRFIIMDALHEEAPKYQDSWNKNLASAYANHLADEEILSLIEKGKLSPYVSKMASIQAAVGTEMQNSSKTIVAEMVAQAFIHALPNLPKE